MRFWNGDSGRSDGNFNRMRRMAMLFSAIFFVRLHGSVQLFACSAVWVKGRKAMKSKKDFRQRIRDGEISRQDVRRMLAELACGKVNDCVRLALETDPAVEKLDLTLLSEIRRNEKGMVEIKLADRLKALQQLAEMVGEDKDGAEAFLRCLAAGETSE